MKSNKLLCLKYTLLALPFITTIGNELFNNLYLIISLIIMILEILRNREKVVIGKLEIIGIIIFVYQLVITLINSALTLGIIFALFSPIIWLIYLKLIYKKDNIFIKSMYILYVILLFTKIPDVFNNLNLSEYEKIGKNSITFICVPCIYFISFFSKLKYHKITFFNFFLIFMSIIILVLSGSSTGYIIGLVLVFYVVLEDKIKVNPNILLIVYLLLNFVILNLSNFSFYDRLNNFLMIKLNKNLTFTGRSYLWQSALNFVKQNFLGYGRGSSLTMIGNECHNAIIEILMTGGIILLILCILFIFVSVNVKRNKKNYFMLNLSYVLIFIFSISGLTESIAFKLSLLFMFINCYNIDNIIKKEDTYDKS